MVELFTRSYTLAQHFMRMWNGLVFNFSDLLQVSHTSIRLLLWLSLVQCRLALTFWVLLYMQLHRLLSNLMCTPGLSKCRLHCLRNFVSLIGFRYGCIGCNDSIGNKLCDVAREKRWILGSGSYQVKFSCSVICEKYFLTQFTGIYLA
jgi:hypothetical protein